MKKALVSTLMIAAVAGMGWRYASPQTREALLGFVGMASRRDAVGLRQGIKDAVLPQDPAERRTVLTDGLKRDIRELQRRAIREEQGLSAAVTAGFDEDAGQSGKTITEILAGAGNTVTELENANKDASLGTKVTERILERILPGTACRE